MLTNVAIAAWRDHDETICGLSGMSLGTTTVSGPPADVVRTLVRAGARRLRLLEPVDARAETAAFPLLFVRELTRHGVLVDWELVLDPVQHDWRELSHLFPPRILHGGTGLDRWRNEFFVGKFIVRKGPGFVQVRDHRWTRPRLMTLTEPTELHLIARLFDAPVEPGVAPATGDYLEALRLAQRIGELLWMPAYRVWRWPVPAEFV